MGTVLDTVFFVVGFTLVVVSLASAFRTVVMPRAAFDPITRSIFLGFRTVFVGIAKRYLAHDHPGPRALRAWTTFALAKISAKTPKAS